MTDNVAKIQDYLIAAEPYYLPLGNEVELFLVDCHEDLFAADLVGRGAIQKSSTL